MKYYKICFYCVYFYLKNPKLILNPLINNYQKDNFVAAAVAQCVRTFAPQEEVWLFASQPRPKS